MDPGNTTAAGARKHARPKQDRHGWKGSAFIHCAPPLALASAPNAGDGSLLRSAGTGLCAGGGRLTDLVYSLKKAFRPVRAWGLEALPEQRYFPEILKLTMLSSYNCVIVFVTVDILLIYLPMPFLPNEPISVNRRQILQDEALEEAPSDGRGRTLTVGITRRALRLPRPKQPAQWR